MAILTLKQVLETNHLKDTSTNFIFQFLHKQTLEFCSLMPIVNVKSVISVIRLQYLVISHGPSPAQKVAVNRSSTLHRKNLSEDQTHHKTVVF